MEKVANEPTSWHRNYNSAMNSALKGLNMQIRKQTSSNSVRHLGMNKKGCTCLINMPYTIQCLLRTANTHTHTHTHTNVNSHTLSSLSTEEQTVRNMSDGTPQASNKPSSSCRWFTLIRKSPIFKEVSISLTTRTHSTSGIMGSY